MRARPNPARVPSPGKILAQELQARNWSQAELAQIIGRPSQMVSEIINARRQITPETALELAEALEVSAETWLNLESNYRLHLARKNSGTAGGLT